jgi:transcriptional regulator with XRE-family HTH domain
VKTYTIVKFMRRDILVRFGQKVRSERKRKGLSQEELASRAGVHRTYIGMIERAEKNITLANIEKICKALGLSIRDFFKDF